MCILLGELVGKNHLSSSFYRRIMIVKFPSDHSIIRSFVSCYFIVLQEPKSIKARQDPFSLLHCCVNTHPSGE